MTDSALEESSQGDLLRRSTLALAAGALLSVALLVVASTAGLESVAFQVLAATQLVCAAFAGFCAVQAYRREVGFELAGVLASALVVAYAGIAALVPVTARDALIHHSVLLRWWAEAGFPVQVWWHEWSFYPAALHLLYFAVELVVPGSAVLIHAATFVLAALLVALVVLRVVQNRALARLAFVVMLSLPVVLQLLATPLVDGGVVLFSALVLAGLWLFHRSGAIADVVLVGISLGALCAIKYNGLLAAAAFAWMIPVLAPRTSLREAAKATLCAGIFAVLVAAPWWVRNERAVGNPVYPLFRSMFEQQVPAPIQSTLRPLEERIVRYGETPLEVAFLPIRMLIGGQEGDPRRFDGQLSPLLLFAIVGGVLARRERWSRAIGLSALMYAALALSMSAARVRYMAPIFPSLVILTMVGLVPVVRAVMHWAPSRSDFVLRSAMIAHLAFGVVASWRTIRLPEQLRVVSGTLSEAEYLRRVVPGYECVVTVNEQLAKESSVYLLYTGNYFSLYRPQARGAYQSAVPIVRALRERSSSDALHDYFNRQKISHLVLHPARTKASLEALLNAGEFAAWEGFLRDGTEMVVMRPGCEVRRIRFELDGNQRQP